MRVVGIGVRRYIGVEKALSLSLSIYRNPKWRWKRMLMGLDLVVKIERLGDV